MSLGATSTLSVRGASTLLWRSLLSAVSAGGCAGNGTATEDLPVIDLVSLKAMYALLQCCTALEQYNRQ